MSNWNTPSLGFNMVLWFLVVLYILTLIVGAHEAYTTKEVDPIWIVLCIAYLWMLNDISKRWQ